MKKYAICLIALSAVSTASLASQGDHEPRDLNACVGNCSGQLRKAAPRAFIEKAGAAAGFEQLDKNPEENHRGGREGGRE